MFKNIHLFLYQTGIFWKTAAASGISWETAKLAGSSHPYLAPLSAILTLQVTVDKSIRFGIQRMVGTIAGVLATSYLTPVVGLNAWSLTFLIFAGAAILFGMGFQKQLINQVALSILLVLYFQNQFPDYGSDRIWDSLIGCAAAILFNMLLFPPNFTQNAVQDLYAYVDHLSVRFARSVHWLETGCHTAEGSRLQDEAHMLFNELKQTIEQFSQAEQSLRFHPFVQKSRGLLQQYNRQLIHLKQGYTHLTGMLRALSEWSASGSMTREDQLFWAVRMRSIARLIKDWQGKVRLMEHKKEGYFTPSLDKAELEQLSEPFPLSPFAESRRFAFALHNDTLELLQDFS